jgi:hypothetical protein
VTKLTAYFKDLFSLSCMYIPALLMSEEYRRVTAMLNDSGMTVGKDRVQRIRSHEGMKIQRAAKAGALLWRNDGSGIRLRPERSNHVWNLDFIHATPMTAAVSVC